MFTAMVIVAVGVANFVVGSLYGKYVLAEYNSLKAHVTAEIAALEERIRRRL